MFIYGLLTFGKSQLVISSFRQCIRSTRAPTVYYLPKVIDRVTVLEKRDAVTNSRMIKVEYKDKQSPLEDNAAKHTITFLKDKKIDEMVRVYHGNEHTQGKGRRGNTRRWARKRGARKVSSS